MAKINVALILSETCDNEYYELAPIAKKSKIISPDVVVFNFGKFEFIVPVDVIAKWYKGTIPSFHLEQMKPTNPESIYDPKYLNGFKLLIKFIISGPCLQTAASDHLYSLINLMAIKPWDDVIHMVKFILENKPMDIHNLKSLLLIHELLNINCIIDIGDLPIADVYAEVSKDFKNALELMSKLKSATISKICIDSINADFNWEHIHAVTGIAKATTNPDNKGAPLTNPAKATTNPDNDDSSFENESPFENDSTNDDIATTTPDIPASAEYWYKRAFPLGIKLTDIFKSNIIIDKLIKKFNNVVDILHLLNERGAILSGSALFSCIEDLIFGDQTEPNQDIDVYCTPEHAIKIIELVTKKWPGCIIFQWNSICINILYYKFKLQLILTADPVTSIMDFDFDHLKFMLYDNRVYAPYVTINTVVSWTTNLSTLSKIAQPHRLKKALNRIYVKKTPLLEEYSAYLVDEEVIPESMLYVHFDIDDDKYHISNVCNYMYKCKFVLYKGEFVFQSYTMPASIEALVNTTNIMFSDQDPTLANKTLYVPKKVPTKDEIANKGTAKATTDPTKHPDENTNTGQTTNSAKAITDSAKATTNPGQNTTQKYEYSPTRGLERIRSTSACRDGVGLLPPCLVISEDYVKNIRRIILRPIKPDGPVMSNFMQETWVICVTEPNIKIGTVVYLIVKNAKFTYEAFQIGENYYNGKVVDAECISYRSLYNCKIVRELPPLADPVEELTPYDEAI